MRNPMVTPNRRLIYSIQARVILNIPASISAGSWFMEIGGIHRPKHFGQSGHPSPAPDTRTSPPRNIRKYVAKVVNMAKRPNLLIKLPGSCSDNNKTAFSVKSI
jgi:hypothetical protein